MLTECHSCGSCPSIPIPFPFAAVAEGPPGAPVAAATAPAASLLPSPCLLDAAALLPFRPPGLPPRAPSAAAEGPDEALTAWQVREGAVNDIRIMSGNISVSVTASCKNTRSPCRLLRILSSNR